MLRRDDPAVERIVPRVTVQRVGRVVHLVVPEIGGLVLPFVRHLVGHPASSALGPRRGRGLTGAARLAAG